MFCSAMKPFLRLKFAPFSTYLLFNDFWWHKLWVELLQCYVEFILVFLFPNFSILRFYRIQNYGNDQCSSLTCRGAPWFLLGSWVYQRFSTYFQGNLYKLTTILYSPPIRQSDRNFCQVYPWLKGSL